MIKIFSKSKNSGINKSDSGRSTFKNIAKDGLRNISSYIHSHVVSTLRYECRDRFEGKMDTYFHEKVS